MYLHLFLDRSTGAAIYVVQTNSKSKKDAFQRLRRSLARKEGAGLTDLFLGESWPENSHKVTKLGCKEKRIN